MSLITRCPACQTLFRVVPDQLRISEGWVRCGQCDEVFDASQNLFQETPTSAPEATSKTESEVVSVVAYPHPESAGFQPEAQPHQDSWLDESHDVRDEIQVDLPTGLVSVQTALPSVTSDSTSPIEIGEPPASDLSERQSQRGQSKQYESDALPAVSFMRAMPQRSVWHRPLVRAILGLSSFLLVLVLAVQITVHERDRLAAIQPRTQPVLEAICAALKCGLSPVRQIESIVVDNASFSKIRGDTYRLSLSVKNTAAIELAMPSLELTLTDSQEQTVLRRVLLPAEFGAARDVIAAGGEWSGAVVLSVRGAAGAERTSGYRVLAFYP